MAQLYEEIDPHSGDREQADWLKAVACARDPEAFGRLYETHERGCYGLAFRILGDSELAKEAFQEAMLTIWSRAERFNPELGTARGWIHRILVRKCLRLLKGKQRRPEVTSDLEAASPSTAATPASLEQRELMAALWDQLGRLPEMDRRLVAMYFGAGLSQNDIGEALEMPQSTVSTRMGKILKDLGAGLTRAGFASAGMQLSPDLVGEAARSGVPVPDGLRELVWGQTVRDGAQPGAPVESTHRPTGTMSMPVALLTGGAILAAIVAWTLWPTTTRPVSTPERAPGPSAVKEGAENAKSYQREWRFDEPTDDLIRIVGDGRRKTLHGKTVLAAPSDPELVLAVPDRLPDLPICVTVEIDSAVATGHWMADAYRVTERDGAWLNMSGTVWFPKKQMNVRPDLPRVMRIYVADRHEIQVFGEENIRTMRRYPSPFAGGRIALRLRNVHVSRIEVRSIATLPAFLDASLVEKHLQGRTPVAFEGRGH